MKYLSNLKILCVSFFLFCAFSSCQTVPETNRSQLVLIDSGTELAMGSNAYKEILSRSKISKDQRLTAILRRVGMRIARVANMPGFKWEFNLIETEAPNAYCLPGGKVGVNTGILPIAQNEAGLATIIGHEVAHAIARHGAERMSQGLLIAIAGELLAQGVTKQESNREIFRAAYGLGTAVAVTLPFSRSHELEADHLGLLYMARAGYDPNEAKRFWRRFAEYAIKKGKSNKLEFLSTHPADEKRISQIGNLLQRARAEYAKSEKIGLGESLM
ncbi:Zn-dependent protease with chaperone function PA4632 [hydrothermal vent metagenome]|uniref:Zn-dependent protease with chaperone function PA4632 n=1 Tax=hydrothermal vent metagenome TaxID=652676 RepID=A0A3B1CY13_9ZZZZ